MTTMQARHIEQKPVINMSFGQLLSYYSGNTVRLYPSFEINQQKNPFLNRPKRF